MSSPTLSRSKPVAYTPNDFKFLHPIGDGSFSTVYLGKEASGKGREFAIKVCNKAHIQREKKAQYVMQEKEVLVRLIRKPHPFLVSLFATFSDSDRLYFVLSLARNGELLSHMRKLGSFDDDVSRFYTAEILVGLQHLHSLGIIHRDMKPENILLSEYWHVIISDFGSAKLLDKEEDVRGAGAGPRLAAAHPSPPPKKRSSFVGTAQYVSPEVLNGKAVSEASDLWALACILYQMLAGLPPFRAPNEFLVFQKINKLEYDFPASFPGVPEDLIRSLLKLEQTERLTAEAIRSHAFFQDFDWRELWKQTPPELHPYLPASGDQPAFHSNYRTKKAAEDVEPGWDEGRLLGLSALSEEFARFRRPSEAEAAAAAARREAALDRQRKEDPYHPFVQGNLILKSGLVDKRKGLFARRRMLLLTEGPRLYYVDPSSMVLKGEIPFTSSLRPEAKNFKTFFVHTPDRTYYLEEPTGNALDWCNHIDTVRLRYFPQQRPPS